LALVAALIEQEERNRGNGDAESPAS
jgi:hypothetical protein